MIVAILLLGICVLLGVLGIFDYRVSEKAKDTVQAAEPKPHKKVIVKQKNKQSKNIGK